MIACPPASSAHFWRGHLPIAFVFSVPGAHEKSESRPVARTTGENLDFALVYLQAHNPEAFPSADRYAYRITNAYCKPIARSLGNSSSQAANSQILAPENVSRVIRDLAGCRVVILCGRKAQLLQNSVRQAGKTVVFAWHTSNQALSSKFSCPELQCIDNAHARRQLRATLWAEDVLHTLNGLHAT